MTEKDNHQEGLLHGNNSLQMKARQYEKLSISNFPYEVLHEVFKNFDLERRLHPYEILRLLSEQGYQCRTLSDLRLDILTLTQVCSDWRRVSLGIPQLWSTLHLTDNFNDDWYRKLDAPGMVRFIHAWLSRAGKVPRTLYIYIHNDNSLNEFRLEAVQRLFTSHPFRKLWLYAPSPDRLPMILEVPNHTLAHLEDVALNWNEDPENPLWRRLFGNSTKFLGLHTIDIHGEYWDVQNLHSVVHLSQLRHITFLFLQAPSSSPVPLFDAIRECQSLESFKLTYSLDEGITLPDISQNIVLPKLRHLEVSFYEDHSPIIAEMWLRLLVIPAVSGLYFTSAMPTSCHTSIWTELILRSDGMPHLRDLQIQSAWSHIDVGVLLDLLPNLQIINIGSEETAIITESTLSELAVGTVGPVLEHIGFRTTVDFQAAIELVMSRYLNAKSKRNCKITPFQYAFFKFRNFTGEKLNKALLEMKRMTEGTGENPLQCLRGNFSTRE